MPEIGETLREARMRARIDVSEIEAKTKIRAKYLRALENEEWSLLPGPTFVKSFLRTYAQALGLDDKALVEEYRLQYENPSDAALEPIVSRPDRGGRGRAGSGGRSSGGGGGPSRGYLAIVGVVVLLIVLLLVGLLGKGGGSKSSSTQSAGGSSSESIKKNGKAHSGKRAPREAGSHARGSIVALSLRASAPVYVCLIDDKGRKRIAGVELQAGQSTSTYHARRFRITLGNSSVKMFVDGREREVPASSQAIGYSVTSAGRKRLKPGSLPTCK